MTNFLLGTVAGGIIACVATITAARHPGVQSRLGLVPSAQAAVAVTPMPMAHTEQACAPAAKLESAELKAARTDKLFEPRRFWFVAP